MVTDLRRKDDKRMDLMEKRFQGFQDQYIKNGKELVRMSNTIKTIAKEMNSFKKDFKKEFKEHKEKTAPMIDWFDNMKFAKKAFMLIITALISVGSLVVIWKQIFK